LEVKINLRGRKSMYHILESDVVYGKGFTNHRLLKSYPGKKGAKIAFSRLRLTRKVINENPQKGELMETSYSIFSDEEIKRMGWCVK
jgi:hypothetical protein